jgi:hypothetical protein
MKKLILIVLLTVVSITLIAQSVASSNTGHVKRKSHSNEHFAPLNGGLGILILLGSAYGIKKMYSFKKFETNKE